MMKVKFCRNENILTNNIYAEVRVAIVEMYFVCDLSICLKVSLSTIISSHTHDEELVSKGVEMQNEFWIISEIGRGHR